MQIPTLRSIIVRDGHLSLLDQIRKLRFGGSLVIAEAGGVTDKSALKVRAKGSLNEKPFTLDVDRPTH